MEKRRDPNIIDPPKERERGEPSGPYYTCSSRSRKEKGRGVRSGPFLADVVLYNDFWQGGKRRKKKKKTRPNAMIRNPERERTRLIPSLFLLFKLLRQSSAFTTKGDRGNAPFQREILSPFAPAVSPHPNSILGYSNLHE